MILTPVKAIRIKCLECSGKAKSIRLCANKSCPLFPYRFGTNPTRKGIGGNPTLKQPIKTGETAP